MNTVEPIRDYQKIERIKEYLRNRNRRDYLLFVWGINAALRISDLLSIKIGDVLNDNGKLKSFFYIKERKTGRSRQVLVNDAMRDAFEFYLATATFKAPHHPLFPNPQGKPLSRGICHRKIARWCRKAGLHGRFGTHSLRKTWGYHARMMGVDLPLISEKLGHSSPSSTRRYLGITQDEIAEIERKINL